MVIQLLLLLTFGQSLDFRATADLEFKQGETKEVGYHNRELLQFLVDNAPNDSEIHFPKALIYFEFEPHKPFININKPLNFSGQGATETVLLFGPDLPQFEFRSFLLNGDGHYTFKDLTIRGPADPGPNGPDNELTYGIYADAFEVGFLDLSNVRIEGRFHSGIHGNKNTKPGPWYWTLDNCDITAAMVGVSMYGTYADNDLGLNINNSKIHDVGYPGATPQAQGRGAIVYTHPHVSFGATNSHFSGNRRWGNQHIGAENPNLKPHYQFYDRCKFYDVRVAVLTSDLGMTRFTNCKIDSLYQGINIRNDIEIIATEIYAPNVCVQIHGVNRPLKALISRSGLSGGVGIIAGGDGAKWTVESTSIRITEPNAYGLKTNGARCHVRFINSDIISESSSLAGIYTRQGFFSIQESNISGAYLYGGILPLSGTERVEVIGCYFDTPGRPAIREDHGSFWIERTRLSPETLPPSHGTW